MGLERGGGLLTKKEKQLLDALEPLARSRDVEIVTVEIVGSKKAPTIRVYVDTPQGVSFDQLAAAQSWINELMDAIDPFPGAYTLEVSSPGIDRPLRTSAHFNAYAGSEAVVKTIGAINGKLSFTGTIVSADENAVTLDIEGEQIQIPFDNIKRAHLKGAIDFSRK